MNKRFLSMKQVGFYESLRRFEDASPDVIVSEYAKFSWRSPLIIQLFNHLPTNKKRAVFEHAVKKLSRKDPETVSQLFPASLDHKNEHEQEIGAYPFIPFGDYRFKFYMEELVPHISRPLSFVDVGSGYGTKPFMFKILYPNAWVSGIEYNKETSRDAQMYRESLNLDVNLIKGDAFEQTYEKYNLVYMYCPMHKPESMLKLYQHIWKTLPVGGVLLEVYPQMGWVEWNTGLEYQRHICAVKKGQDGQKEFIGID